MEAATVRTISNHAFKEPRVQASVIPGGSNHAPQIASRGVDERGVHVIERLIGVVARANVRACIHRGLAALSVPRRTI